MTIDVTVRLDLPAPLDQVLAVLGQIATLDADAQVTSGIDNLRVAPSLDLCAAPEPEPVPDRARDETREPESEPEATTAEPRDEPRAPTTPKPRRPGGGRTVAAPGSTSWLALAAIADEGGIWIGSQVDLIRHVTHPGYSHGSARATARRLVNAGLITLDQPGPNRSVKAVHLTGDGWRHLNRRPTSLNGDLAIGVNAAKPPADPDNDDNDTPWTTDPIDPPPVDHDAARARAAGAL